MLKGRAEFDIHRNDMFWNACILDGETLEFFHPRWSGYNDAFWWDNVAEKNRTVKCTGSKGTEKYFRIDYHTLDVIEVNE